MLLKAECAGVIAHTLQMYGWVLAKHLPWLAKIIYLAKAIFTSGTSVWNPGHVELGVHS